MTFAAVSDARTSFVKWFVRGVLAYWALYALVAPLTIYDSHVYDVARLLLFKQGGFFRNHLWNANSQICWPWAFDAVHYPFIWLGAGFDLPSFACLLGILVVIHQLVGRRYGVEIAWWCDLAVLAMPTVVYQGTSSKNDMPGAFGIAVWFYALCFWRERRQTVYVFWMALALAFVAGAKISGLPMAALLSVGTLWALRGEPPRRWLEFTGAMAVCTLLFGSAETYLNNYLLFRHPLGDPAYIQFHRNIDGVAGGTANLIRYTFETMNIGVDAANPHSPVPGWLADGCRATLHFLGLDNVGYRRDFNDSKFQVLKIGLEAASDYGPVGALALLLAFGFSVSRRPADPLWKLSAAGLAVLADICLTAGWMPWNNRYLLVPFILFGIALVLYALREGPHAYLRQNLLLLLLVFSTVVYPLHSVNRRPADLLRAFTSRESLTFSERPAMREVVDDLRARVRADASEPLVLTAGEDSWTYDILKIHGLRVLPTPTLNQETLAAAELKTGAGRLLVLLLNRSLDPALAAELTPLNTYAESDTSLYEWRRAGFQDRGPGSPPILRFTNGWYAEEGAGSERFRWMSAEGHLSLLCGRGGTVRISARVRSFVPGNSLDLLVDGRLVTAQPTPVAEWQECAWQVAVPVGIHDCAFRSRQPGKQPPNDDRSLTVCVENVRAGYEP